MMLVPTDREASSRRMLAAIFLAQGTVGLSMMALLTIVRADSIRATIRALGSSATLTIVIFVAFAFALSLLKFKLTDRVFVALGLTAATTMLPILGMVITAWIAVAASAISRLLSIHQIGPNKSDLSDPAMDYLRAFGQFGTYGIPILFGGTIYRLMGGSTPVHDASWTSAGRITVAGLALLFANHVVMKQVEVAYEYSPRKMLKVTLIDGSIYVLTLPFAVLMALSYASLGVGALLGWAFTGVLLDLVARKRRTSS